VRGVLLQPRSPPEAPIHPWVYPDRPWQRLHVDLAGPFLGRMWFVLVDAHSKWPVVVDMAHNTTSSRIIYHLRQIFADKGLPQTIVSDNGPQFISRRVSRPSARTMGSDTPTSSAYHPRTNGEAERFVKTFKHSLKKSHNQDLNLALCSFLILYRVTPHITTGVPPADLIMKHKPQTLLDRMRPDPSRRAHQQQERMVENGPSSAVRQFQPGNSVWVKTHGKEQRQVVPWSHQVPPLGPLTYIVCSG